MPRYLFIGVFGLALLLAAVAGNYKMNHTFTRTDELAAAVQPLQQRLHGLAQLRCYLGGKELTEALIRGRFALAPLVLVPVTALIPGDTVLMITRPGTPVAGHELLWCYADTGVRYSLVRIRN